MAFFSLRKNVGEVISLGAGCFQWTIHDFLSQVGVKAEYECLRSPAFIFSDVAYFLQLDKNGLGPLTLRLTGSKESLLHKVNVKLGMRTGYRGKIEHRSGQTNNTGNIKGFYVAAWMSFSEILDRRCEILTDGRLTVFCELRTLDTEESASGLQDKLSSEEIIAAENEASERDSDEEETDFEWKTFKRLQRDLKNLLLCGEDYDVTIKVQGKEFPAHRIFLRARSPVFKSMFSHEMVEKQSGVVVIDDCDPAIFSDFLNYLYTGSTKHISNENVFGLYTVSDKYCVKELKEQCVAFLKCNMSIDTFCDTMTLAVLHSEKEPISVATEFFCSNATEIMKTAKWQTFLQENTTAGNELIILAFSKKN